MKVTPTEIASTAYSNGMRFMQSLLVVGKMLVDPALDERDAFGIDLLHAQRRHAGDGLFVFMRSVSM